MPKHVSRKPKDSKICVSCGRPFEWRKKWEKVWGEVKYCSKACRGKGPDPALERVEEG